MMKNLLFVYICLFGLALPLSAQKLDAQDILDRTATTFRQAGGIQADFTVQTYAKGVLQGSSVGTIRLKGEKFLLDADGVKTWFDGRTQWSYLTNSDEVNVSEPTPEELQSINPYALLSIYKQATLTSQCYSRFSLIGRGGSVTYVIGTGTIISISIVAIVIVTEFRFET